MSDPIAQKVKVRIHDLEEEEWWVWEAMGYDVGESGDGQIWVTLNSRVKKVHFLYTHWAFSIQEWGGKKLIRGRHGNIKTESQQWFIGEQTNSKGFRKIPAAKILASRKKELSIN
jgi:hypothetical protein